MFNVLAMVAEFESDLIKMRTREGMKVTRAKGRLRGKKPKLSPRQWSWGLGRHGKGRGPGDDPRAHHISVRCCGITKIGLKRRSHRVL